MESKKCQGLDPGEIVQAVVLYDTFEDEFLPMSNDIPLALLPMANHPLIDYTLRSLDFGGVNEVFLFCCKHAEAVKAHIENCIKEGAFWLYELHVEIIVSETCLSYGDCLRDLDARGLLRGYFILVDPGTISNVNLLPILEKHKEQTNKDKGTAMTLVYLKAGVGGFQRCPSEDVFIGYVEKDDIKKVVLYDKVGLNNYKRSTIPMSLLLKYPSTTVESGLKDTHIAICSPAALHLFTDNFDFQTKDDFIKGLLINEETLGSTMYLHIVDNAQYGSAAMNWRSYQILTRDLLTNWAHPIKPPLQHMEYLINEVYTAKGIILPKDMVVAKSVIGKNVKIGRNVRVESSIIMDNVSIGDSVVITDSIIGPSCTMESECSVTKGSVLGKGVVIAGGKSIETRFLQATAPDSCDNKDILGEKAYVVQYEEDDDDDELIAIKRRAYRLMVKGEEFVKIEFHGFSDTEDDDDSRATSAVPEDDVKLFFNEVIESLTRGFEEKLPCADMILEVNSSRYAYNVTVKEVNFNVTKAVLLLSLRLPTGQQLSQHFVRLLEYFSPILKKYIRDEETMGDALQAIEEVSMSDEEIPDKWILSVLKYFYEKDVISEDAVINWYDSLEETSHLRAHVKPFAEWLKDAEEESSEESADDSK